MDDETLLTGLKATLALDEPTLQNAYDTFSSQQAQGKDSSEHNLFIDYLKQEGMIDSQEYRSLAVTSQVQFEALPDGKNLDDGARYKEHEAIAEGGVGQIFLGRDRQLSRNVAIKRLKEAAQTPDIMRRFVAEARVTAQLDHPNVIPVYSLHRDRAGDISFAMKLVHGKTLEEVVKEVTTCHTNQQGLPTALTMESRLEHFLGTCDAIHYAHSRSVLHRDLKPSNIMVGEFHEVYVMDWGIARRIGDKDEDPGANPDMTGPERVVSTMTTQDGKILGTPQFMSPEQIIAKSSTLGPTSDVYALGLILFQLTTLQNPFRGSTILDVLSNVIAGQRRPIKHRFPRIPIAPELVAIIEKATALAPEDRYPSAYALAQDVRRFMRGDAVTARPENAFQKVLRFIAQHRIGTLATILALVLISAFFLVQGLRAEKEVLDAKNAVLDAEKTALDAKNATLNKARKQQEVMARFQADAANRSHQIDSELLRLQGLLEGLAYRTAHLIRYGITPKQVLVSNDVFNGPSPPNDFGRSAVYGKAVSLNHPVYKLAPGVTQEAVAELLGKMAGLKPYFQQMLELSYRGSKTQTTKQEQRKLLLEKGGALRWAYVGLKKGVMISYPGKGGYAAEYDPRKRPWYRLGDTQRRAVWGNSYIDSQGQGLVLPGVIGIYGDDGSYYGVAGVEVTFNYIINTYLLPSATEVGESFLVDSQGNLVIRSTQITSGFEGNALHEEMKLQPFPHEEVFEQIKSKKSGLLQAKLGEERWIFAYNRCPTIGWYFVHAAPLLELSDYYGTDLSP